MKILVIVQRSNGDVFLTLPLIRGLQGYYPNCKIDMLVNDDTLAIAKTLPNINDFIIFSYAKKKAGFISRIKQEKQIISKIWRNYDLCINLTASDRSVQYAIMASRHCISAIENEGSKSWWKKLFLKQSYTFFTRRHMIFNMLEPLRLLGIEDISYNYALDLEDDFVNSVLQKYNLKFKNYIIFHPSAQYWFRTYPLTSINKLLEILSEAELNIVVTGSGDEINRTISKNLIIKNNITNLIGKTSLKELFAIIKCSKIHIGMDTLNTHLAASYGVNLIAIYGPNGVCQWSPFNSDLLYAPEIDTPPITKYGNFIIFQANMSCVPCNKNGCNGEGKSECLYNIDPYILAEEVINFAK